MCYLSLFTWNMLLFRRLCVINSCYWAVIVSCQPPFANRAIHFHLVAIATFWWTAQITFLKSVLCSSAKMSHGQHFYISVGLQKGRFVLLSASSNSLPNLVQQVVSPKEISQRWLASISVCYVSSSSSTIIVITLTEYLCKQGWSARF